tara:strand:+ start:439 stop:579 length:141 start_codon:yes stop_codon:yes gene_type:complete
MIKSVIREHHWLPQQVSKMYLDSSDHRGLEYWYEDVQEVGKELNKK